MDLFEPKPGATKLGGAVGAMDVSSLSDYDKIGVTKQFLTHKYGESGVATGMGYGFNINRIPGSTRASFPGYGLAGIATIQPGGTAGRGWDFGGEAATKQGSVNLPGQSGFGFARTLNIGMAKQRTKHA